MCKMLSCSKIHSLLPGYKCTFCSVVVVGCAVSAIDELIFVDPVILVASCSYTLDVVNTAVEVETDDAAMLELIETSEHP